ncbi:MAG: glutamate racemase [Acidimicrobiia bacterium]
MGRVGVFDSGVGGLSVLNEFLKLAPGHPLIYVADQAMAPYGERSLTEVRDRAVAISSYLVGRDCDVVVVACNSASAAALHHLREVFPAVRFVGMEPAVKPAATQSRRGVIGVLATDATFQGELYASVLDRHANGATVIEQACPGLAGAIEQLGGDAEETRALVARYVTPLRKAGVDTLVLGCTHYPFVLDAIAAVAGPDITVVDPAPAVARQVLRMVGEPATGASVEFLTTGNVTSFRDQVGTLVGIEAGPGWVMIGAQGSIRVIVGDLTRQNVDVIVNAANTHLQHGGGVAGAIVRAGGAAIQTESTRWVREHGPLSVGGAAVTGAGALPAAHVVHVAGPIYRSGQDNEGMLRAAVSGALDAARAIDARTIAFPAISAGIYGYPVPEATAVLASEVVRWLDANPGAVAEAVLVALDGAVADLFRSGVAGAISPNGWSFDTTWSRPLR